MRTMGDRIFIAVGHNVSFMGRTWWTLTLVLRLLVLLLAGFPVFGDEQERFICNTIQPGCSNVCFDAFSPVSVLRLWLVHLVVLCLPHVLFASYEALPRPRFGGSLPLEWAAPRFYCAYSLVVVLRIFLEVAFGAGQFVLFGLSVPKSVLCYEAPCTSGVECYVSRPTEKTLMLDFMLGVSALSVLLSLGDLVSSVKTMVRWRTETDELSKVERSSVFTTTTEDGDVHPKDETAADEGPAKKPESQDSQIPKSPHFVPHGHLRPPLSRGPHPRTPMGARKLDQQVGTTSDLQSDSSESQDKRAWV